MRIETTSFVLPVKQMKYYESSFEDYIHAVDKLNLHPELLPTLQKFPKNINQIDNMIIYGSSGIGKYSQVLHLLKKYSPSELKYEKKIIAITEKQQYKYHISDIHYEIDMSLLGCNSKMLWHEIFFQIIDIVSVKPNKFGIILCKNFHLIHSELLEIFYSYMQQYNHSHTNIRIKFFILTEHISFLPNTILNYCHILRIKRPSPEKYIEMSMLCKKQTNENNSFIQNVSCSRDKTIVFDNGTDGSFCRNLHKQKKDYENIFNSIDAEGITNIKEIYSFPLLQSSENIPKDVFNVICDNIIHDISNPQNISFTGFRDKLYEILTYNLDINECIWYILSYFICNKRELSTRDFSDIIEKTFFFLKYFNNNYRPIFHLESIMYYVVQKLNEL
jgi:hypothetical protein